jgi:hypothetical protein
MNDVSAATVQTWKTEALQKGREKEKEAEFLLKLKESADLFTEQLVLRSVAELRDTTNKGFLRKKFFFENFKQKFGPVKVSTHVKGFHVHGVWDPSIFQKIGMVDTPFQNAVSMLKQKGISLRDVSDISKGAGFWLEVGFLPEEKN